MQVPFSATASKFLNLQGLLLLCRKRRKDAVSWRLVLIYLYISSFFFGYNIYIYLLYYLAERMNNLVGSYACNQ